MSNQRRIITKREVPKNCIFCKENKNPDFMEIEFLRKFLSERGKILSASKTGLCMKHQKKVMTAVKRARHLALLPFMVQPE
ncbi:MAG: 30S ribosomal protein S18 [Candidatus Levyibacteriota bacterium]